MHTTDWPKESYKAFILVLSLKRKPTQRLLLVQPTIFHRSTCTLHERKLCVPQISGLKQFRILAAFTKFKLLKFLIHITFYPKINPIYGSHIKISPIYLCIFSKYTEVDLDLWSGGPQQWLCNILKQSVTTYNRSNNTINLSTR